MGCNVTIYRAEDKTKEWIKDNFPGVTKVMDTDTVIDLRNKILKGRSFFAGQDFYELRTRIFYETAVMAGYSEMESHEMSQKAFQIFINARNDVKLFDGVRETLVSLSNKYSLGVITNGNADLKRLVLIIFLNIYFHQLIQELISQILEHLRP